MQKTALLAGATGLIGSQLLPLLLASERYAKVIVVGRRAVPTLHPKLVQVVTELDKLEDVRLQAHCRRRVLLPGHHHGAGGLEGGLL